MQLLQTLPRMRGSCTFSTPSLRERTRKLRSASHIQSVHSTGKETHGDSGEIIGFNGSQARLPRYIFLVRHGESEGNLDPLKYRTTADNCIELTEKGHNQALDAGNRIAEFLKEKQTEHLEQTGSDKPIPVFFYYSPYERSKQTTCGLMSAFEPESIIGKQEEVQLREQDFGNFQDDNLPNFWDERLRFGRFFYRFPNGESGCDVYDRITIYQDHVIRDMEQGRFPEGAALVLVTHGLTLRIFLMRWYHWTVREFESVYNPPNATPVLLERVDITEEDAKGKFKHTKSKYRIAEEAQQLCSGVTDAMCITGNSDIIESGDDWCELY
ncbi:hypothetical protein CYMTET_49318 [Cymbomonas tetramitiformis]|uniref:Phosphoglycerate mutase n=1 Tax=Cymbomonas tetramitiformis TaxID=36881 RepID=A0AAE0BS47_9CHLO|nr:hypothetical protein CYMTET_49318 [Cymbomonas tetramitiformis]